MTSFASHIWFSFWMQSLSLQIDGPTVAKNDDDNDDNDDDEDDELLTLLLAEVVVGLLVLTITFFTFILL